MQVAKEEKEDDLASDKEDKLAEGGEEAWGKRAGRAAQKWNHLIVFPKCSFVQDVI